MGIWNLFLNNNFFPRTHPFGQGFFKVTLYANDFLKWGSFFQIATLYLVLEPFF